MIVINKIYLHWVLLAGPVQCVRLYHGWAGFFFVLYGKYRDINPGQTLQTHAGVVKRRLTKTTNTFRQPLTRSHSNQIKWQNNHNFSSFDLVNFLFIIISYNFILMFPKINKKSLTLFLDLKKKLPLLLYTIYVLIYLAWLNYCYAFYCIGYRWFFFKKGFFVFVNITAVYVQNRKNIVFNYIDLDTK